MTCLHSQVSGCGESPRLDEGVTITGPTSSLICPIGCGPLVGALLDEQPVGLCPNCRGLLLPAATFNQVVAARRRTWQGVERPARPIDPDQLARAVPCPGCQNTFETHPYYGPGNTIIDSCAACDVVWVDAGEITELERVIGRR